MKDRLLTYAIAISVVAHLGAAVVIGRTSAARLASAPPALAPRYVNVELIDLTAKEAPKANEMPKVSLPVPAPRTLPATTHSDLPPTGHREYAAPTTPSGTAPPRATAQAPGNPGGQLDMGTPSEHGDLTASVGGGGTSIGHVPSPVGGQGNGSGTGPGVGTPEPVRNAAEGPNTHTSPAVVEPTMVNVKVCAESGMLPGPNCKQTRTKSFVEGRQPKRTCNECQPEQKSRLADRAAPEITRDSRPSIPSSVEEGLSVRVEIQYTVTADGDVTDVEVTKSSGNKLIDRAVVRSASNLKYKPAVQDGVPRSVKKTRGYTINT